MVAAESRPGGDPGDGQLRPCQYMIYADEWRNNSAVRPRHVGGTPPRRGPVGQPVVQEGDEPAVTPRGVEVPDHQHATVTAGAHGPADGRPRPRPLPPGR